MNKKDKIIGLKLGTIFTCMILFGILIGMDLVLKWYGLSLIAIVIALFVIVFAKGIDDDMREFYKRNPKDDKFSSRV